MPGPDRHLERAIGSRDPVLRTANAEEDRVLRAKYLDWCSAQLADRFLKLTPDEIYELAHRTSPGAEGTRAEGAETESLPEASDAMQPAFSFEADTFREIVDRVTRVLAMELALPAYDDWVERYRAEPDAYDDELLGFWQWPSAREREEEKEREKENERDG